MLAQVSPNTAESISVTKERFGDVVTGKACAKSFWSTIPDPGVDNVLVPFMDCLVALTAFVLFARFDCLGYDAFTAISISITDNTTTV